MIQPAGDEEASSNALTELSLRVQEFDQEGNLAPAHRLGLFPFCLRYFRPMPMTFLYRCPNTRQNVQGWSAMR
jgi:hypothetical protein